jgi:hypothetical protein
MVTLATYVASVWKLAFSMGQLTDYVLLLRPH